MSAPTIEHAVHQGDCLDVLPRLEPAAADLLYLDPPFNTGQTQTSHHAAFPDRWPDVDAYLEFMTPRLAACIDALTPDGILLVHCDWRTVHHLRLRLDAMLGADRFVNHLIWSYGLGGSSPRRFARKHDDILFYARSDRYHFEAPRVPATSRRMQGMTKKATDVIDVPAINNMAAERVGYPTQKPLALLDLLVGACCPPGGLVVDPFCGSGTTLVAAARLKRRSIGIDVSEDAVGIARRRLGDASTAAGLSRSRS